MIGRVYKIICSQTNDIYIGSTTTELRFRFAKHKNKSSIYLNELFDKYGKDQFKIILIKEYNIIDKEHLLALEQLWINKLKPINKQCSFQPLRDRHHEIYHNNDHHKQKRKEYYQRNKEIIKERTKQNKNITIVNCGCGGSYRMDNKARHLKTKKHLIPT
jgi:glucose-6-phosphate isomerase